MKKKRKKRKREKGEKKKGQKKIKTINKENVRIRSNS